jgi:hypothetical protein
MIALCLWRLQESMPGLTASHGASLGEAAGVCLESQQHNPGVMLRLEQPTLTEVEVHWRPLPSSAHRCHTGDRATEDGACGVAILLALELTGQVVLFRSERGRLRLLAWPRGLSEGKWTQGDEPHRGIRDTRCLRKFLEPL